MERKITKNTQEILIALLLFGLMFVASEMFAQHQIGHTQITFQDANRGNRDIQTEIYYPASAGGDDVAIENGSYPVVVFGHGFVMSWDAYENLWEEFVPRGYVMVFPRTEGSIIGTDHQKFGWDLQFLVTEMQNEGTDPNSLFYQSVAQETALMGHSMGGGAAFLAADSLVSNGNINLKTLIGLAPAESSSNGVSSINSSLSVTVPSLVLSGSQDGVTPPDEHHIPMFDSLASSCKTFVNVLGGAHCYFANSNFSCDFGEGTSSSGISITREDQHEVTFDFVNLWLDYTLKGDCNAFSVFNDSLETSTRVNYTQVCALNPVPTISFNAGILTSSTNGVSYQWYLGGTPLPNSNMQTISVTQDGDYTVEVFYGNGCPETSLPFSVVTTRVVENGNNDFKVFPNPSTGRINIQGVDLEKTNIQLFSVVGKSILNYSVEENQTINLSFLPEGIYFLKLDETITRIIITR